MKHKLKLFNLALISALIISLLLGMTVFSADCQEIKDNTLRLHIKANSDSEYDQNMKLFVRDKILSVSQTVFADADGLDDALLSANANIDLFRETANNAIREYGSCLPVNVTVEKRYFNTREYGDFTLPAGEYNSLCIDIGKAEGHNWWCVIFPMVCIGSAGKLSDAVGQNGVNIAENPQRYIVKFKIIEIYEAIKDKFIKK